MMNELYIGIQFTINNLFLYIFAIPMTPLYLFFDSRLSLQWSKVYNKQPSHIWFHWYENQNDFHSNKALLIYWQNHSMYPLFSNDSISSILSVAQAIITSFSNITSDLYSIASATKSLPTIKKRFFLICFLFFDGKFEYTTSHHTYIGITTAKIELMASRGYV